MQIYKSECSKAGLDEKRIAALARIIEKAARELHGIGVCIFGASTHGSLRFSDGDATKYGELILASMGGLWDGGNGACWHKDDGLLRGEL